MFKLKLKKVRKLIPLVIPLIVEKDSVHANINFTATMVTVLVKTKAKLLTLKLQVTVIPTVL